MPKHKTRNTQSVNEIWPVYILQQEKKNQTFLQNRDLKTSSRPFCACKELSTTSIGNSNF